MEKFYLSLNNSDAIETIDIGISKAELWFQIAFCYSFLGVLTLFANIFITVGIKTNVKLRRRFFVIIGSTVLCRALIAYQFIITGLYRILRTTGLVSAYKPRLLCMAISSLHYYTETLELTLLLLLAIDRAAAILAPNNYRNLSIKGAVHMCIFVFIVVFPIKVLPLLLLSGDLLEIVPCININSAPSSIYNQYSQNLDLTMCFLILVLYTSLAVKLKWKMRQLSKSAKGAEGIIEENLALNQHHLNSSVTLMDARRINRLMPTFRNLVLAHCAFTFTAKFLLFLSGQVEGQTARFALYSGVFLILDQCVNVVVLISTNRDVRNSCLPQLERCSESNIDRTPAGLRSC